MSKAKAVKGKDLMVFVGGKATALATNHTLTLTADTSETSSKDSGIWGDAEITKINWEATTEAITSYDADAESFEAMFSKMILCEPVDVVLGIPANKADELQAAGWNVAAGTQIRDVGKALIT